MNKQGLFAMVRYRSQTDVILPGGTVALKKQMLQYWSSIPLKRVPVMIK